ncbi:MAG: MarR family winged helix-turn-helix transcriptional regulator [Parvibaculaceae bacterium]
MPESDAAVETDYPDLWSRPGYLVRRLHQIHVGIFADECRAFDLTPVQYGLLTVLQERGPLDQVSLSSEVGIDRTSGADVMRRLERRGIVERTRSAQDRRANTVRITALGARLVREMQGSMARAQQRFLAPLDPAERRLFTRMMQKIINGENAASRAPLTLPADRPAKPRQRRDP